MRHILTCSAEVPLHFHQHQTSFDRNQPKADHCLGSTDQDGFGKKRILLPQTIPGPVESVHQARTKASSLTIDLCQWKICLPILVARLRPHPVCAVDSAFHQKIINLVVLTCFHVGGSQSAHFPTSVKR